MKLDIVNHVHLSRAKSILKKINQYAPIMEQLSDEQLQQKTIEFKERLQQGESLDYLLPEAYATVREAAKRVIQLYPYDVQVIGAIVLHQGNIAEMKTGEGKTLTATMPLYLNALTGKGSILVTPNEYLARRDAEDMGKIYRFLGLSVEVGFSLDDEISLKPEEKKALYAADIVYTTSSILAFDYLLDNLAESNEKRYMRPFHYVIIDEVDSVLLDSAQMPLIISGGAKIQSNMYQIANEFILTLTEKKDYILDEDRKNVAFTADGIQKAERYFNIVPFYSHTNIELVRNCILALKAHTLFKLDKDYVVKNEEIVLLDSKSGRMLPGTKLSGGQHQALEAKEYVKLSKELQTIASITYQNFFKQFDKMSGMSGTVKVVEEEFIQTYNMNVVVIPTNKPILRRDLPDSIYADFSEKIYASLNYVKQIHQKGQPILIVAASVAVSDVYSQLLLQEGISHNVLNAHNVAKEAEIIKEAGKKYAVTVATPMAGRGTDIKISDEVAQLGGLVVIGLERMESKRIDLQVRGRSGRQGDPGHTKFFVSLDDDLLLKWGPSNSKHKNRRPVNESSYRRYQQLVDSCQDASDSNARVMRDMAVQYDESLQKQRQLIYRTRNNLLKYKQLPFELSAVVNEVLQEFIESMNEKELTETKISRFILDTISYQFMEFEQLDVILDEPQKLRRYLKRLIFRQLKQKEQFLNQFGQYDDFLKVALLKAIDECWVVQIGYLQVLKTMVVGRTYAQHNPLYEYEKEAALAYQDMKKEIKKAFLKNISLSTVELDSKGKVKIYFP